ncbi:MAG: PAS domain-containing protein, partial [Litorimonas sp.]
MAYIIHMRELGRVMPENLDANLMITIGAVLLAIISAIFAFRAINQQGTKDQRWKDKAVELDNQIGRYDSIFGAYPGLILVWEETTQQSQTGWGEPRVYGSPAALASMMRFADSGKAKDLAMRVLNGISDLNTISEQTESKTLRHYIGQLRHKGEPFSISIVLPEGNVLEADGRVAGRQVVLWLEDASIRGEDERKAISRFETNRITSEVEPVAFIEMMSRAPFPLWRMNGSGKLTWVNAAYVDAVGASNMREVLSQQIHLDDSSAQDAKTTLSSHKTVNAVRNIVMGGQNRATALSVFPINGGVAGLAIDASETEALREALTVHIRAHDTLLNSMDEAIVTFSANQKMRFHNKAFASLFKLEDSWFKDSPTHGEWLDHLRQRDLLPLQADYRLWKT